jgi:hypothetical protein
MINFTVYLPTGAELPITADESEHSEGLITFKREGEVVASFFVDLITGWQRNDV